MFNALLKIQLFFEALYHSMISLLRVLLRLRFKSGFSGVKTMKSDVIVLANGPSLRQDLDKYESKISLCNTIAVNLFVLTEDFIRIKPDYYIFLDVVFLKKDTLPRVAEVREKMLLAFKQNLKWEMVLLLPAEGRNSFFHKQLLEVNLPVKFVFFNRTSIYGLTGISHCIYSRGWGMPPPQNVLIGALMAAIHIGFQKIYVLGADHSWLQEISIDEKGVMLINDKHFYNPEGKKLPKHHGESLEQFKIHQYLNELSRTFKSHIMVQDFAKKKSVEIINASSISYIDAYKKINTEDIPWDQLLDK